MAEPQRKPQQGARQGSPHTIRRTAPGPRRPPQKIPPEKMELDVHIRSGLDDELVRMDAENWNKVLTSWMIGGEDITIRTRRESWESTFVLRGNQNAKVDVRAADPQRALPKAIVMSCEEMRYQILEEKGLIQKKGGE